MTDQEFQKFVIDHLVKLTEGQEELRQSQARMEFKFTEKIDALFDGYQVINEKLDEHTVILTNHTDRLQRIEDKVEKHDIQIQVLDKTKSNKRKASK